MEPLIVKPVVTVWHFAPAC